MKKGDRISANKPLRKIFYRNYLVISSLMLITFVISLLGADVMVNNYFNQTSNLTRILDVDLNQAAQQYTYDEIDEQQLEGSGGWIEILDATGHVIRSIGDKRDNIEYYSQQDLFAKLDILRTEDGLLYQAFAVKGPQGEDHVLLWKFREAVSYTLTALIVFAVLFTILFFGSIYFYSRYSVRKVKKPLQQITQGMKEMEQLNYTKRLSFQAEQEFADIREAFNRMAERIELASAEKEAAEKNKQNMLLYLSHDLKTPITSILGFSLLLMDNPQLDDAEKQKYIKYIHQKSAYLANLIHDLFELAKLDDHRAGLHLERVNLTEWYRQLVAEWYPEAENKGFLLEADIPEQKVFVQIDKVQMKRVIMNLLGNSLLYNPPGTLLSVACEVQDGHAVLLIGDNGVGVQEEIREHLFDEFIRGDGAAKGTTGLGLAISKRIVVRHGGTIELVRDEQYASLFRISLPCEPQK